MQKSAGITASRPLRFNYIENQIFVTLKQQPVLSLLTPAGRSSVESPEPQLAAQIGLFLQTLLLSLQESPAL